MREATAGLYNALLLEDVDEFKELLASSEEDNLLDVPDCLEGAPLQSVLEFAMHAPDPQYFEAILASTAATQRVHNRISELMIASAIMRGDKEALERLLEDVLYDESLGAAIQQAVLKTLDSLYIPDKPYADKINAIRTVISNRKLTWDVSAIFKKIEAGLSGNSKERGKISTAILMAFDVQVFHIIKWFATLYEDATLYNAALDAGFFDSGIMDAPTMLMMVVEDQNEERGTIRLQQMLSHPLFTPEQFIENPSENKFYIPELSKAASKFKKTAVELLGNQFIVIVPMAVFNTVAEPILSFYTHRWNENDGDISPLVAFLVKNYTVGQLCYELFEEPLQKRASDFGVSTIYKTQLSAAEAILKCPQFTFEHIRTHFLPAAKRIGNADLIKLVERFVDREAYASFFHRNQKMESAPTDFLSQARGLLSSLVDFLLRRTKSPLPTDKPALLIESKDLLNDYTKGNSIFWRTVTIHSGRKHAEVINEIVEKIDDGTIKDLRALQSALTTLYETLSDKEKTPDFNESGSCARRIEYILREIGQALDVSESAVVQYS